MSDSPADNPTFEQALAELEQIVHDLEDGQIGLEESLARYEKGVGLLKRCYGQLREAEQRISLLAGVDDQEQPVLKPFEQPAAAEASPATKKPRKKADSDVPF